MIDTGWYDRTGDWRVDRQPLSRRTIADQGTVGRLRDVTRARVRPHIGSRVEQSAGPQSVQPYELAR